MEAVRLDRPAPGGDPRRPSPKRRSMSMRNLRSARWIVLVLGLMLVAAACGGGGGGGNTGNNSSNNIKEGGTLNYAANQEPTGFNPNTSKDNGTSVLWVVNRVYPSVFQSRPDFSVVMDSDLNGQRRADQSGPPDHHVQDQAERGLVGRHAGERRRLHLQLAEPERQRQEDRRRQHHRLRGHPERHRFGQRQDRDGGLQEEVRRLEVAVLAGHGSRALRQGAGGRLEHGLRQEPPEHPVGRP